MCQIECQLMAFVGCERGLMINTLVCDFSEQREKKVVNLKKKTHFQEEKMEQHLSPQKCINILKKNV